MRRCCVVGVGFHRADEQVQAVNGSGDGVNVFEVVDSDFVAEVFDEVGLPEAMMTSPWLTTVSRVA